MKNKHISAQALIKVIRKIEMHISKAEQITGSLRDLVETPLIVEEIRKKNLKVSTQNLQKHFGMGYARAARLVDLLKSDK